MRKKTPMEMYADKRNASMKGGAKSDKAKLEKVAQPPMPKSAMKGAKPEKTKNLANTGARMTMAQAMGKTKGRDKGSKKKSKKPSR